MDKNGHSYSNLTRGDSDSFILLCRHLDTLVSDTHIENVVVSDTTRVSNYKALTAMLCSSESERSCKVTLSQYSPNMA